MRSSQLLLLRLLKRSELLQTLAGGAAVGTAA